MSSKKYRLDFEEFEFDGGSDVDKPCDRDFVEIFSGEIAISTLTHRKFIFGVHVHFTDVFLGSAGNLGNGKLCGNNRNQHLYIPIENDQARPMVRIIADGRLSSDTFTSVHHKFSIKITQIDCNTDETRMKMLRAPQGCLQYFTDRRGTINSFNRDPATNRQYVPNQRYTICIRKSTADCRLEIKRSASAPPFSTSVGVVPMQGGNTPNPYADLICGPDNGKNFNIYISNVLTPSCLFNVQVFKNS